MKSKLRVKLLELINNYIKENYIELETKELNDDSPKKTLKVRCSRRTLIEKESKSRLIPQIKEEKAPAKKKTSKVWQGEIHACISSENIIGKDFDRFLERIESTWCSEVFLLIDENNFKDSAVYKRAGISKQTFSKLRKDLNYRPKRDTAIQMCIGLKLNLDQSIDLLAKAGFALSNSSKRDLVVRYFIDHKIYDINEMNEILYEFKLDLFNVI